MLTAQDAGTGDDYFAISGSSPGDVMVGNTSVLFNTSGGADTWGLNGFQSVAGSGYFRPAGLFEIRANENTALVVSSLSGPSALFQTSATDGSNANGTVVIKGNTAQTANLLELYGADGTTLVGNATISGVFAATGFTSVGGDPAYFPNNIANPDLNLSLTAGSNAVNGLISLQSFDGLGAERALSFDGLTNAFYSVDDNVTDLGITGTNRWKRGFFGGNVDAASYSCSAMPAAPGASGTIYADPVTHALFITP
jgi:hypothetical protein